MSEKIEGYSYQEHEPTPDDPCEIKKMCNDIYEGESWQPMIDLIKNKNKRIEELKDGLHKILKLNEYMIHCSSKRVINKLILKQWYLIYKVLGEQRPGIAFSSKEDKVIVLTQQRDLYKEVIEEVMEYIRDSHVEVLKYHDEPSETTSYEIVTVELLQILDKVKEVKQ